MGTRCPSRLAASLMFSVFTKPGLLRHSFWALESRLSRPWGAPPSRLRTHTHNPTTTLGLCPPPNQRSQPPSPTCYSAFDARPGSDGSWSLRHPLTLPLEKGLQNITSRLACARPFARTKVVLRQMWQGKISARRGLGEIRGCWQFCLQPYQPCAQPSHTYSPHGPTTCHNSISFAGIKRNSS